MFHTIGIITVVAFMLYGMFSLFRVIGEFQAKTPEDDVGWALYFIIFLITIGVPSFVLGTIVEHSSQDTTEVSEPVEVKAYCE